MAAYIGANVFVTGANRGIGIGLVRQLLEQKDVKRIFAGTRKPDESKVCNFFFQLTFSYIQISGAARTR